MKENLMSGSMWQGMKTRHGVGTEALSEEMESNRSATPKSRRHPLTLPADGGDSPAKLSFIYALAVCPVKPNYISFSRTVRDEIPYRQLAFQS